MQFQTISFIGAGNMSFAIIQGLVKHGYPKEKIIACHYKPEKLVRFAQIGVDTTTDKNYALTNAEIIILAVKPQAIADCSQEIDMLDLQNKFIISIIAGCSIKKLSAYLPSIKQIIRVMPNTPSLVGAGMSAIYADVNTNSEFKQACEYIFNAVGKTCWLENEKELDLITVVSGCGPAYFFLLMELLQKNMQDMGFDQHTSRLVVEQVAAGASQMVYANQEFSIAELREQVTSKKGLTAAALDTFAQHDFDLIVKEALQNALNRGKELEAE